MKKERADQLLVQQGLAETADQAKRMIMAGQVYTIKEQRVDTAGEKLPVTLLLQVKGKKMKYVSRGGFKLEKALDVFKVNLQSKIVLDIGSSTGGFTDAALQNGASLCYALDVGTNQLAWKLRTDERVVVMEQTNFRDCVAKDFVNGIPQIASIDVSFISLEKILPVLKHILVPEGDVLALIKPQFEARREEVGRHGIVSDPDIHEKVLTKVLSFSADEGYKLFGLTYSPITGGEGNIEYLAHLVLSSEKQVFDAEEKIQQIVTQAHAHFHGATQ